MVVVPALLAVSNESVLKTIASLTSIFVGIRLGSFVLGLFWAKANEKGVIVGSIMSVIAVFTAMYLDVACTVVRANWYVCLPFVWCVSEPSLGRCDCRATNFYQ